MRTKRNREPEQPRPEPWNPEQWPEPEPEPPAAVEPESEPEPEPEPAPRAATELVPSGRRRAGAISSSDYVPPTRPVPPSPRLPELPEMRPAAAGVSAYAIGRDRSTSARPEPLPSAPAPTVGPAAVAPIAPPVAPQAAAPGPTDRLSGAAPDPSPKRKRLAIAGGIGAAALVGVGLIGWSLIGGDDPSPAPVAVPSAPASVSAAPADADCPARVDGKVTTGRDPGDQLSGPGVIKAFDHAYYNLRSGVAARALGTRTARMGKPEQMQGFIDQLPKGTRYCLRITDLGTGLYAVELSEIRPGGGAEEPIRQNVQTTEADGKHWIISIEPAD